MGRGTGEAALIIALEEKIATVGGKVDVKLDDWRDPTRVVREGTDWHELRLRSTTIKDQTFAVRIEITGKTLRYIPGIGGGYRGFRAKIVFLHEDEDDITTKGFVFE